MRHIFLLSGDYTDLATEEILSLFECSKIRSCQKLFAANLSKNYKDFGRLALTKSISKLLFECKLDELAYFIKKYDWNLVYQEEFCLRIHDFSQGMPKRYSERELSGYIWKKLAKPKVDLKNAKTKIEIFICKDKAYCGLKVFENKEDFEARKAHLRPFPHPSSMHPKLARALVNILGIKENEVLLDPFCGTGGFLIEAALMNIKIEGFDISKNMVKGCIENLKYFKIKNYKISEKNALSIKKNLDYTMTDLPYGLNSNIFLKHKKKSINEKTNKINLKTSRKGQIKNIEKFYLAFLKNLRKKLDKKAVIIFPSFVNHKSLLKKSKFRIEKEFEIYVHRSLTRKIVKIK